jgi:serine/threonine-protein kinase
MIGNVVGPYKITEKIGEGGMGAVYKGIDTMLEREVAIKMLRPELSRQPDVLERFRTEAVTLARLNHPNIATLYSFLQHEGDYFMVMEFVRGNTIESIIKNFGAIAYERAIPLFCQALEGIDHAHKQGIVHRDIKPANVMVLESGAVKVMDFGIARVLGSARMTRQGNVVGTVEYMSPEQIRGEDTEARSDIYSLGILLYEMLTGRVPFTSTSEYEIMKLQIEEAPPQPTLFVANLPLPVEQAIMRALAKKADARYQTAGEFRAALLGALSADTNQLSAPTANYAAPATKVDRNAFDSAGLAEIAKGTMIAGSINEFVAASSRPSAENPLEQIADSSSTQKFASEAKPNPTGQQQAAPVPKTQAFQAANSGFATQAASGGLHASGQQPTAQVQKSFPQAAKTQGSSSGKLKGVHFAGIAVLLIALVSVPAALMLRKPKPAPQTPTETQQTQDEQSETPQTQTDANQTPVQTDNQNANSADVTAADKQAPNSNTAEQNKNGRKGRTEKTDATATTGEEAKQAEPVPTPTSQEAKTTPPPTPAKDEKQAVAKEGEKKEEKKEEKKKGGGIGGFFKKVFGGGDKKKEEKKP